LAPAEAVKMQKTRTPTSRIVSLGRNGLAKVIECGAAIV
jgi:hypothetical protein